MEYKIISDNKDYEVSSRVTYHISQGRELLGELKITATNSFTNQMEYTQVLVRHLKKSSQSREVQEESTAPTESEKKDFGKKLIKWLQDNTSHFPYDTHKEFEYFLSSNGYL